MEPTIDLYDIVKTQNKYASFTPEEDHLEWQYIK